MGHFSDGYRGDSVLQEGDEFRALPKMRKTKIQYHKWNKSYSSPSYSRGLKSRTYKKEVVFKIINKGIGRSHANTLMKYLMRELDDQKERAEPTVTLEGSNGKVYTADNYKEILDRWAGEFYSSKSIKDQKLYADLEEYSLRVAVLENKKQDKIITAEEGRELSFLKTDHPLKKKMQKIRKDFTHIMISLGGKEDPRASQTAIREFLKNNLKARGYEYLMAFHKDTKNHHFHVMVKNTNLIDLRKTFSTDKFDLHALRQDLAATCDLNGIDRVATRAYDREDYLKTLQQSPEKLLRLKNRYEIDLARKDDHYSFNAFKFRENILKQLNRFIEQTQKQAVKEPSLRKAVKILKGLKAPFSQTTPEEFFKQRTTTAKELEKHSQKVATEFVEAVSMQSTAMPEKNRQQIIKMAKDLEGIRQREIEATIVAIKKQRPTARGVTRGLMDVLLNDLEHLKAPPELKPKTAKEKPKSKTQEKESGD